MNKAKARAWKRAAGLLVMVLLCWQLYCQIHGQINNGTVFHFWPEDTVIYFLAAAALLPLNVVLESLKWQRLVASAVPLQFLQALRSVLGGIAASLITPNRIGEYPARIIQMKERHSVRLVSVSVLGACAQLLALMLAGLVGLGYYCVLHPQPLVWAAWAVSALFTLMLAGLYFSFERWAPYIERFRWLRKLRLWGRLLFRFSLREQMIILGISVLRFLVYSIQYWLLLRWQNIALPLGEGLLLCALFFWAMAVIPSIALAELGIRGVVSLFVFRPYSSNAAGIAYATFVLWLVNLMLPALAGAWLFLTQGSGVIFSSRRDAKKEE
ncbi:MAG: flippase-like domain-containing protein [Bacteroidetes bacterium]|nr:flippase-like domain-containing protein [Bacteroidota bacterium]